MKSKVFKFEGRSFRYDYDHSIVEWVSKADAATREDEREWIDKFGEPLYGIDDCGYYVVDSIGLNRKNWEQRSTREEYLWEWVQEIEYELKCELKSLRGSLR